MAQSRAGRARQRATEEEGAGGRGSTEGGNGSPRARQKSNVPTRTRSWAGRLGTRQRRGRAGGGSETGDGEGGRKGRERGEERRGNGGKRKTTEGRPSRGGTAQPPGTSKWNKIEHRSQHTRTGEAGRGVRCVRLGPTFNKTRQMYTVDETLLDALSSDVASDARRVGSCKAETGQHRPAFRLSALLIFRQRVRLLTPAASTP